MKPFNYSSLLTVQPLGTQGTRVTKVTKKDYGYRIQKFNPYVILYYIKLIVNENKSAKAHYKVDKNYCPTQRYTLYFNTEGDEITLKEYRQINKTIKE